MPNRLTYLKKILLPQTVLLLLTSSLSAQLSVDYKPLMPSESIPKDYIVDIVASANKSAASNTVLTGRDAKKYFTELYCIKSQVFEGGDVYLPNALTKYIDTICGALLKNEPGIRDQVKIYVTRYSSTNAFSLADGSVFVNLGLLSMLDNESELAFVLAHEIAHFALQHSVKDFAKAIAIRKKESSSAGLYTDSFRRLRFSRESEMEADSYALSLMSAAGFDTDGGVQVLEKFKQKPASPDLEPEKTFNNAFFKLDTAIHVKELLKKLKTILTTRAKDNADSRLDDLYETHPDIDKRIASVKELERNIRATGIKRTRDNYSGYKTIAAFEQCGNNLREQDYLNCIINSLKLQNAYPNNAYLIASVSQSLYWISYFKEVSKGDLLVYGDVEQNTESFCLLYALFEKMNLKDTKQLAYAYLRSNEEKIATIEALDFYLALCTENFLGKVAAQEFYRTHERKFPGGIYSAYVKDKLK